MSEIKLPIQLRTALAEDVGFIFNSWLKSYRSSDVVKPIMNEVFFAEQHRLIEHLITQHKVIIACNADNPDQVYGFICAGATEGIFTVHYIYVKQAFRRMGIAKMLLEFCGHDGSNAGIFTHYTFAMKGFSSKFRLFYQPYVLTVNYNKAKESTNE